MSNPWEQEEQELKPQPRFGQLQINHEHKKNKTGGKYWDFTIHVFPVADGKNPEKREFSFAKGYLNIFQPSIHEMVKLGKAGHASEFFSVDDLKWISYQWSEFRSYDSRDINNNKERYPEGNKKDKDGVIYANIRSIQILDVYPDEDACLKAHDEHYKIDQEDDEIPDGFAKPEPITEAPDTKTVMAFFDGLRNTGLKPVFRAACSKDGLDLDLVKQKLVIDLPMMANLDFEDEKVKALIKEVEAEPPF